MLLNSLAAVYGFRVTVNRDSPDRDVLAATRQACRRTHPDKGGSVEHQQQLNAAREAWEKAKSKPAASDGTRPGRRGSRVREVGEGWREFVLAGMQRPKSLRVILLISLAQA